MKLIANNGEVLAEWTPYAGKRNLYCSGGFGLMLTRKAMERCLRADDTQTIDIFEKKKIESGAVPAVKEEAAPVPVVEEEKEETGFSLFGMRF